MTALDDVRILDLSRLLPGPFCTMLLADLGADVIKVEDTSTGDYMRWMPPMVGEHSAMFRAINRNKRSVALDLKQARGREAFLRMVERADVVLEGFRPGVIDRLGIGYASLRERNPRVVLCSISGYGQDGPYRERAGHDLNYAALAGVLSLAPSIDGAPAMPSLQVGDLGGGALQAAVAILAALHERERTGRGQHCDVAMLDGLVRWMAPHTAVYAATGEIPGPGTLTLNGRVPCYRTYRCADGAVSVGALEPKFWRAFVTALGLPHLADSGLSDGDEGARAVAQVEASLATRTRADVAALMGDGDVCCEPVLSIDEVFEHPQVRHRANRSASGAQRDAPGWGADTRELLTEAGYDAAGIAELTAARTIR